MVQTAFVTGATSGLGRATALALAEAGFDVAVAGRSEEDLSEVASAVRAHGRQALGLVLDLADPAAVEEAATSSVARFGGVDVLVNAAATDAPGPAEQLSLADWERVLRVNLTAPFLLARALMPSMGSRGGGLVVNISSVAGRRGWADASAYCSTKFALTGLSQSLAAEGRDRGIRVCCLYPGAMATAWGTFDPAARSETGVGASSTSGTDALDPASVARLVVWMATDPGKPVLNEVTVTPVREQGWP